MREIAYQNKDIASKLTGEALIGRNLAPFGRPDLNIVDALPANLPAVESNELRLDNLFLLSDGSVAIIDYESGYELENFVKYLNYAARVVKRYAAQKRLGDLKRLKIIVIYTADVETALGEYDLEGIKIIVESAYLAGMDTEAIYNILSRKIQKQCLLSEEEMMQMMILPLTVKGTVGKQNVIERIIELAKKLKESEQTTQVLAGLLTFTDKVIDNQCRQKIKEAIRMTRIEQMIFSDGVERGMKQGMQKGMQKGMQTGMQRGLREKAYNTAYNLYLRGFSAEDAAGLVEEKPETVSRWYAEWKISAKNKNA